MIARINQSLGIAASCFAFCVCSAASAAEPTAYRAFVADHANGKITVIDALSGKVIANYGVEGPARLKASPTGAHIFATQGPSDKVNVIESGIRITSHGDHVDVEAKAPRMTSVEITGPKPSHVNPDGKRVAVFFDGDGQAKILELARLQTGKTAIVRTAAPHHGLSKPMGDLLGTSIPHPTDAKALPVGLELTGPNGASLAKSTDCPRLHGEAQSGSTAAFGCADGVLLLNLTKTSGSFEKVPYPTSLPADRMVRNLAGGTAVKSFFGDFGADGMVVLDPVAKTFSYVGLPARRMHFARDTVSGDFGYVVTEDGKAHKINALTGKIEASVQVTESYSMEGGSAVARPRVSASGDRLIVTDPAKALIHVIDATKMTVVHKVSVPGAPFDVVLVGASGETH